MPAPWLALPAAILFTPAQGASAPQQPHIRQVYGDLTVEAQTAIFTKGQVTFEKGVRATFASEVLTADTLTLYPPDEKGVASGHVILHDPAGLLSADDLNFSWKPGAKGGTGQNAHLDLAGVMIDAQTYESIPGNPPTEIFTNVVGTSCARERTPLYTIHSPKVIFIPGKEGIIRHPTLYLFGRRIITLPTHHFTLDPRVKGIPLPGLAFGKGKFGILWAPSEFIDSRTALSMNVRAFRGEHFTADAYASRSFLSADKSTTLITPHSDLSERFTTSYFDSIRVAGPDVGQSNLRASRNVLSVGSSWNHSSTNDRFHDIYSKLLEGVYEVGGPVGRYGYQASVRAQDIRINDDPFHARLVGAGSLGSPSYRIRDNLFATARLDASSFLGPTAFGWLRGEAGLYTTPTKWLTLAAGYGHGIEAGKALFPADRLVIRSEAMGRADFNLGPRQLSLLFKRDFDRGKWYREYKISQIVGCLQAFVVARQFPRSYQLGVTLRIDDFLSILHSRKLSLQGTSGRQTPAQGAMPDHVHP